MQKTIFTSDAYSPLAKFDVTGLDDILNGGLTPARMYLIEGDPGTGKTTLAMQFLLAGAQNKESCLYITLSESKEELKSVAHSHDMNLEGITIVEILSGDDDLAATHVTMFHPSEIELSETTKAILSAVEEYKPQRIIIDSLSELRLLSQHSLRYRRQILALKRFFMGKECTVILLDDKTADATDRQPFSIAHGVISLEGLAPDYGSDRRRLRIMKFRGSNFSGGYHDFIIQRGGLEVFARLVAADETRTKARGLVLSGVSELDQILGGGISQGTSTLIVGPAGAGKSSLAMQYAIEACKSGERAAAFIFEEGLDTVFERLSGMGQPIEKYVASKLLTIQQVDPAELSPGQLVRAIRDSVEKSGAKIIILDSLNGYLQAMPGEKYLIIQLHELLTYLAQRSVATILVMPQHGIIGSSMSSSIDASYLADSAILLRYFEDGGRVRKAISVVKKRTGRHEDTIRELEITAEGIKIGPPLADFHGVLTGIPTKNVEHLKKL